MYVVSANLSWPTGLKLCSNTRPRLHVVEDTHTVPFATRRGAFIPLHILSGQPEICSADKHTFTLVFVPSIISNEDRFIQDWKHTVVRVVCLRHLVGFWDRSCA